MDAFCVFSFFCLHLLDWVQWMLCLISMIHSMMLSLCLQCCFLLMWWKRRKSELLMNIFCVFLLSSPLRLSSVSVVFVFSDSLNDVAPGSPILLSLNKKKWKAWIVDGCLLCVFFVFTHQIEFCKCCVWFQWFTQWCCSCVSGVVVCYEIWCIIWD